MTLLARARAGRLGEAHASDARIAAIFHDEALTRRQLAAAGEAVRVALGEAGLSPGDSVLFGATNTPWFLAGLLGAWSASAVVFPVESNLPFAELEALRSIAESSHVLGGDASWVAALARCRPQAVLGGRLHLAPTGRARRRSEIGYVLRQVTSGTLGRRRHVLKTWRNLLAEVAAFREVLAATEEDTVLGVVPFCHAYGLHCACLLALDSGATVVLSEQRSPRSIIELMDRHAVTLFPANPFLCDLIARSHAGDLARPRHLRYVISSGGPLGRATEIEVRRKLGVTVVDAYGSTETGLVCVHCGDRDLADGRLSERYVGRPVHGVTVSILDEHGQPAACDTIGRIGVCSPAAAACDERNDDQAGVPGTDLVFPGDLGFLDQAGGLHLVGRDDVVNLGGLKVAPADVCAALRAHPAIEDAAVVGCRVGGRPAVGAMVASHAPQLTEDALQRHCASLLARHEIPKKIAVVPRLPQTPTGKLRRSQIAEVMEFLDGTEARRAAVVAWCLLAPESGLHAFHAKVARVAELNRPLRPRRTEPGFVPPAPAPCPHPVRLHGSERLGEERERPLLLTAWHHTTLLHCYCLLQAVPEVRIFTASRYLPAYTQHVTEPLEDNPLVGLLRMHKELRRRPVYLAFDGPVGLSSLWTSCLGFEMELSLGLFGLLGANPTARLLPTCSYFRADGSVDFWIGPELLPPAERRELPPAVMLARVLDYFTEELKTKSPENVCLEELLSHGAERARRRQRLARGAVCAMRVELALDDRLAAVLHRLHGEAGLEDWRQPFLLRPAFDSMAMLTLLVEIENEFGVVFAPEELASAFDSPASLRDSIAAKLQVKPQEE